MSPSYLDREQLQAFLAALGPARAADVLEYLDEELRTEFLESVTPRQAAELVSQMTPDDRADTLEEIDEEQRRGDSLRDPGRGATRDRAAALVRAGHRRRSDDDRVRLGLGGHDGGGGARERARGRAVGKEGGDERDLHDRYAGRVAGVMSLRELLAAPRARRSATSRGSEVVSVTPSADREEVARVIANYDMVAVPVVSESGHVMGVITVDDVIDAIQEEQTEDVQKFGGMEALDEPYMHDLVLAHDQEARGLAQRALPWRDVHDDGAAALSTGDRPKQTLLALFVPLDHELGRQLRIAGDVAASLARWRCAR